MADPADSAYRRGLARILAGISLILFGILLAAVESSLSTSPNVGGFVVLVVGVIGLLMVFTGYGEITEVTPAPRR